MLGFSDTEFSARILDLYHLQQPKTQNIIPRVAEPQDILLGNTGLTLLTTLFQGLP